MVDGVIAAPANLEEFRELIRARFPSLSDRLQRIGRHLLDDPHDFAFETLAVVAERGSSQPSAIVRFAQSFGFEGATQMQRLVREGLLQEGRGLGYAERIRQFRYGLADRTDDPRRLLSDFVEGSMLALENLHHAISAEALGAAIDLLANARFVFAVGFRRALPSTSLLTYLLAQAGKPTVLIDGLAGLHMQQARAIGPDDVLVATTFAPYSSETADVAAAAVAVGCPVLAITDSTLGPVAEGAALTLLVRETEVHGFRSLSATTCLVQSLAIGLATRIADTPPTTA